MIKLNEVHKVYTQGKVGFHALKDINLYFERGETIAIYGPSGCGKTTLLNILGGLDTPTSGDMVIGDKLTTNFIEREWDYFRNHRIGFIFQQYNLIEHLPIVENVALSIKLSGESHKLATAKAIDLLKQVGLENHLSKLPGELSGGERQRVAVARALINDPDIILADEPTGALDMKTGTEIMDLIKSISKDKLVIIVTHNKKIAKRYSTRMIELKDGRVTDDTDEKDKKVRIVNKRERNKSKLKFKEAVRLAIYNIRGKKWRTFLVALGLSVGIVGLILVDAFFNSIRSGLEQQEQIVKDNPDLYVFSTTLSPGDISTIETDLESKDIFKDVMYAPRVYFNIARNETDDADIASMILKEGIGLTDNESLENTFTQFVGDSRLPLADNEFAISTDVAKSLISNSITLTDTEVWDAIKNNEYLVYTSYNYFPTYQSLNKEFLEGTCKVFESHEVDPIQEPGDWDELEYGLYNDNILELRSYTTEFLTISETEELYCQDYSVLDWEINYTSPTGTGEIMTLVGIYENDLFYEMQFTNDFIDSLDFQDTFIYSELDDGFTTVHRFRVFLDNDSIDKKAMIIRDLEDDGYIVYDNYNSGLDFFEGITSLFIYILQFIFSAIISIAIVTGGLMLLLILYIGVIERKREIGLIRSMGGTKGDVRVIYSGETTIIGFMAGILSVIISVVIVLILNVYIYNNHLDTVVKYLPFVDPTKILVINYGKLVLAIFGSIVIALISGLIPSMIAAKKKPIEALRNE